MLGSTIDRAKITVYSNLLKQINSKVCRDLYRIQMPSNMANTMVVGIDVCHAGRRSLIGLAASYNAYLTQHYSKVYPQELHKELIGKGLTKDQQETKVA